MDWQPIETAPKDGTWILVSGGKAGFDDYMKEIESWPQCMVAFCEPARDEWSRDYWAVCFWDGGWRTDYESPTHWMPLPEPPK